MKKILFLLLVSILATSMLYAAETTNTTINTVNTVKTTPINYAVYGEDRGTVGRYIGGAAAAAGVAVIGIKIAPIIAPIAATKPQTAATIGIVAAHIATEAGADIGDKIGDYVYDKAKKAIKYVKDKIKRK